jgi:hypothetical protein
MFAVCVFVEGGVGSGGVVGYTDGRLAEEEAEQALQ